MNSYIKIFNANLKDFLRNKKVILWIFVFPVCFLFLFDLIINNELKVINFDYILPWILALTLMQLGFWGGLHFLRLQRRSIISELSVTPLSYNLLLSTNILIKIMVALFQSVIIILMGVIFFDFNLIGNLIQFFLIIILGALLFLSFGYMVNFFAENRERGKSLVYIVQIFMIIFSGLVFQVDIMPSFMQSVAKILPLTSLADLLRQVILRVPGNFPMEVNILILFLWQIFTFIIIVKFLEEK